MDLDNLAGTHAGLVNAGEGNLLKVLADVVFGSAPRKLGVGGDAMYGEVMIPLCQCKRDTDPFIVWRRAGR